MLIQSISGVRGLVESHLTPKIAIKYAKALHKYLPNGVIITGRDSRPSGELILQAMTDQLIVLGRSVVSCGIVPTPTVQFMVNNTEAVGGFIVTASHNPIEWNGIKFLRGDSTFFHPEQCKDLFKIVDSNSDLQEADERGLFWQEQNAIQKHIISCVSLSCIDLNRIRKRKFKVVIDAVNGAGSKALPAMLESLGCEVLELNCEPNGQFTRGTEPLPEHLDELSNMVKDNHADVGFAVDPDADRLAVISEKGDPLGEEYTIVLVADGYIKQTGQVEQFVVNLSTSLALEKLAEIKNCSVTRSSVGEINVVNKMIEIGSKLGGEGNGGVILKESHLGRDSLVGVTMVLNRMSQSNESLSSIHKSLPQFDMVKDKVSIEGIDSDGFIERAGQLFDDAEKNTIDGIKFTWNDRWVHLRKSNTEPIMRIYAEATDRIQALELVSKIKNLV